MTQSQANDIATPAWSREGKSVYELLDHLFDTVEGAPAPNTDPTSLADLQARVAALETHVGIPGPQDAAPSQPVDIPPADSAPSA